VPRGRGQLNPDGSLSNNNVFRAPATGRLVNIALFLVQVLMQAFGILFGNLGLAAMVSILATTALLGVIAITVYAWVQNIRGHYAEVPVLSDAAYAWIRY
jgi:hypothetical protein